MPTVCLCWAPGGQQGLGETDERSNARWCWVPGREEVAQASIAGPFIGKGSAVPIVPGWAGEAPEARAGEGVAVMTPVTPGK